MTLAWGKRKANVLKYARVFFKTNTSVQLKTLLNLAYLEEMNFFSTLFSSVFSVAHRGRGKSYTILMREDSDLISSLKNIFPLPNLTNIPVGFLSISLHSSKNQKTDCS
jgi:hypothetical protein